MEYRNLGNSGLQVSVVGIGCNNFGDKIDAAGTKAVVEKCVDMGITFFDTADIYSRGKSEEFVGAALRPHRRDVVIATKSAAPMGEGPYRRGTSRKYLMDAVEDSLRRLDTDYIDLYQMHFPTPDVPIEETLRALNDLVRSGKVRYIGCSNYPGWQVVEAAWISRAERLTPFISAQNQYNLLERTIEKELVPAAKKYGLGILPYFPLASGFLTGKYRKDAPMPDGARLSGANNPFAGHTLNDANYDKLEKLDGFAKERGHTMTELAFGWLASLSYISSIIAGATRPDQVEENATAAEWKLTGDEMDEIDEILGMTPPTFFGAPGPPNPR